MAKMFFENQVPAGESTTGMTLVRNRTETAKTVTEDGHVLGARERAWVTSDDPVLLKCLEDEVVRVVNARFSKSARVDAIQKPPVQVFNQTKNEQQALPPVKTNPTGKRRKPKK